MSKQPSDLDTASNVQVGGAYIGGSVHTENFVGRDQITITVSSVTEAADLYTRLSSPETLTFTSK